MLVAWTGLMMRPLRARANISGCIGLNLVHKVDAIDLFTFHSQRPTIAILSLCLVSAPPAFSIGVNVADLGGSQSLRPRNRTGANSIQYYPAFLLGGVGLVFLCRPSVALKASRLSPAPIVGVTFADKRQIVSLGSKLWFEHTVHFFSSSTFLCIARYSTCALHSQFTSWLLRFTLEIVPFWRWHPVLGFSFLVDCFTALIWPRGHVTVKINSEKQEKTTRHGKKESIVML